MIDLILWANNRATLAQFAVANNLFVIMADEQGNEIRVPRRGIRYFWWNGSGDFMTARPEFDENGDIATPATFLPGIVAVLRIFTADDAVDTADLDPGEDETTQWARSKVARYIKTNGEAGTIGGISYYEIDGVRIFRPAEVTAWLSARNLPGHEWVGGNSY